MAVPVLPARLGPAERPVFVLRAAFDFGYRDIATTIGRSEPAPYAVAHVDVRQRLRRRPAGNAEFTMRSNPSRSGATSPAAAGADARMKLLVALVAGVLAGVATALGGAGRTAPLVGWDVLAVVFGGWTWRVVWRMDAPMTQAHARAENPSRDLADALLLGAAIASLVAVGVVLFGASHAPGNERYWEAALALFSVFVSWTVVHTVFALKYARLYYTGEPGGISFNESDPPQYSDFAYLAFTIGMTFQVSDTALQTKEMRRTALRHAWLSFPLGAVIIATSINLVSGLAK